MKAFGVTGYGVYCEEETAAAYRRAGAEAEIVHAEDLFSGARPLSAAAIVHITGGFSFGDNLGSGRVFATRLRYDRRGRGSTLAEELLAWTRGGGQLIGVCNGFQILVKSGLLPNLSGKLLQELTLAPNTPSGFVDRWVRCRVAESPSPAFAGVSTIDLPIRHGEGRLLYANDEIAAAAAALVPLRYAAELDGRQSTPNGSTCAAAALTDPTGRVLGMMPHPEAFLDACLHPNRGQAPAVTGQPVFDNIVAAARSHA